MPSILIVDDLISIHEMLEAVIEPTGFSTAFATDGEKGLARYKAERFDLVLADIDMKPMDGITLLRNLKTYDPAAVVTIMTAYASTDSAIQALKYGAFDYLQKPFKVDELIKTLKRALEFREATKNRVSGVSQTVSNDDIDGQIIGKSPTVRRLIQQIRKLVDSTTPLLLQGEIGVGKSHIAEVIHKARFKDEAPFVRIDCSLSTDEGFQTGLLGENGSGGEWIAKAGGGTLFLENLQSLPNSFQAELVSVLRNRSAEFGVICSSTVDLEHLVDEGKFSDELFFRVAAIPLMVPPLRDRLEDISLLIKALLTKSANPLFDGNQIEFTKDALQTMGSYYWPGNLAEFNQVVSKVIASSESRLISSRQLPMRLRDLSDWPSLEDYVAGQEREYISIVLHTCRNDVERALKILKCDPSKIAVPEPVTE
jgi:DNA-binding NtrC family response regulator